MPTNTNKVIDGRSKEEQRAREKGNYLIKSILKLSESIRRRRCRLLRRIHQGNNWWVGELSEERGEATTNGNQEFNYQPYRICEQHMKVQDSHINSHRPPQFLLARVSVCNIAFISNSGKKEGFEKVQN